MNSRILLLLVIACWPAASQAQSDCANQARTDLERLYCKILLTPHASKLPSFNDFRNNNPKVQQSLLRGPARRLGLALPDVTAKASASVQPPSSNIRTQNAVAKSSDTKPIVAKEVSVSLGPRQPPEKAKPVFETVETVNPLAGCQLSGKHIVCQRQQFFLQQNQNNARLKPEALGSGNLLLMREYQGDPRNEAALQDYLLDSYRLYIEKMLAIGLGGATMSYTKFYYTYRELLEKRENFASRFGQMYEYLKKDKATMGIKSTYHDKLPSNLAQCGALSESLVVCDDGAINWVYVSG